MCRSSTPRPEGSTACRWRRTKRCAFVSGHRGASPFALEAELRRRNDQSPRMGQGHGAPDVRNPGADRRSDSAPESTVLARKSSFDKSNDCKPRSGEVCPAAARNDNSASKSSRCGGSRSRPAPNQAPAAMQRAILASPSGELPHNSLSGPAGLRSRAAWHRSDGPARGPLLPCATSSARRCPGS